MKKTFLALTMLLSAGAGVMAQHQEIIRNEQVQYHFFTNNIPSEWNYPLIGFVNNVNGNHESIQIGIVNNTTGNFGGVQSGFINSVGGKVTGFQSGFINAVNADFAGIQHGFINSTAADFIGIQSGFINSNGNKNVGVQCGFINSSEQVFGVQTGFINASGKGVTGVQCGFINSTGSMTGLQYGFINSANTLNGLQLGFINSVDNIENGLPIGFLSFVKHGGFKAIEVSYNDINPFNIAFKTGIREFYTYPVLAYDWRKTDDRLSFGYGIGSNFDINNYLFINPEIEGMHQVSLDFNHYSTLRCNLGFSMGNHFEILAGPSLVWHFKINAADFHQHYTEWDPSIIAVNKVTAGFNVAARYKF